MVRQPGEAAASGAARSRRVDKPAVPEAGRSKLADKLPFEASLPLGVVSAVLGYGVLVPVGSLPAVRVRSMFVGLAARPT